MKLVEDRKVCWQDQYEGWHVGVTFLRDGRPVRGGEGTLVRHKHTGELEMVNDHWLKDYPMEPIPEPGVKASRMRELHQQVCQQPDPVVNAEPSEMLGLFNREPILCGQGIVLRKKG